MSARNRRYGPGYAVDHANDVVEAVTDVHVPRVVHRQGDWTIELCVRIAAEPRVSRVSSITLISRSAIARDRVDTLPGYVDDTDGEIAAVQNIDCVIRASPYVADPAEPRLAEWHGIRLKGRSSVAEHLRGAVELHRHVQLDEESQRSAEFVPFKLCGFGDG